MTQVATNEIITAMATYPGTNAAMVAFEGVGAACPSGQSGNLVMLEITASAIATAWCASFNGSGAPMVDDRIMGPLRRTTRAGSRSSGRSGCVGKCASSGSTPIMRIGGDLGQSRDAGSPNPQRQDP
jgi:hypothetical protein